MPRTSFFAVILTVALAVPVSAHTTPPPSPTRIRGTVENFADHTLTIKARDGNSMVVTLAPDFTVRAVVAKTLADIKPGDRVGITSVEGPGGVRRAIEIHIFPASLRTVRMGEFPWDRGKGSLMTNAPVAAVTAAPQGRVIKVTVNGKEREIVVPPDTPIITYAPGDAGLLKSGAAVFVTARKQPDGRLTAASVTAEQNGVKPPM
jgi:hypothetical protein